MTNQIIRQYTDPERGPAKINTNRKRYSSGIAGKRREQKQLQDRFIPSKEQEELYWQSFSNKPWLTR